MVYSFSYLFLSDTVSSERYFFFSSLKIHLEFIASFWGKQYFIWFCDLLLVWDSVFFHLLAKRVVKCIWGLMYRIVESLRLEKTSKIILSSGQPITTTTPTNHFPKCYIYTFQGSFVFPWCRIRAVFSVQLLCSLFPLISFLRWNCSIF